jgi:hypothetical protein
MYLVKSFSLSFNNVCYTYCIKIETEWRLQRAPPPTDRPYTMRLLTMEFRPINHPSPTPKFTELDNRCEQHTRQSQLAPEDPHIPF